MLSRRSAKDKDMTHQKMMRRALAAIRAKHTKVEKPDEFCVRLISMYWGMYGTTPPITIAVEANSDVRLAKLIRFHPFQSSQSSISESMVMLGAPVDEDSFADKSEE